jgi:hypothetical protein
MPPLLAALLMIELGCDLRIVQAIDLGFEWRLYVDPRYAQHPCDCWYAGCIGVSQGDCSSRIHRGTYAWPSSVCYKRYANH